MASLYKRTKSPFWWIKWRNPETGKVERISTKHRVGIGTEFKNVKRLLAQYALKETHTVRGQTVFEWVPSFLQDRYKNANTLNRVLNAWENFEQYFEDQAINNLHQIKRSHCLAFPEWRKQNHPDIGLRSASLNTALLELKVLRIVMKEAVHRGIIDANPCADLGIKPAKPRPKQEFSDADIAKIRREIKNPRNFVTDPVFGTVAKYDWPHILHVSFEIALAQGCRISETYLDLRRDVDLEKQEITFHAKGGQYYTAPMNPSLIPLFQELKNKGRITTYTRPAQSKMVALYWHKFLKRIGLHNYSFHCTRVTCISRLERAGAPEHVVMALVNHASTTVHRVYRRLKPSELQKFWSSLPTASNKVPSREIQDSSPTNQ